MNSAFPAPSFWAALFCVLSVWPIHAAPVPKTDAANEKPSYFFPIAGAKDCAYDESRQRLYVTTPKGLVIVDTKTRKVEDLIELNGTPQGCDISLDSKFLVIAPIQAQSVYRIALNWTKFEDIDIKQIKFKADANENGVFGICVGSDDSVLFSTTFKGSGGVKLRRMTLDDKVEIVGNVNMDSMVTASAGDRRRAAVAEGNISSGPLKIYDFEKKELGKVADLQCFHFEIACAADAKYFARPDRKGCELYDSTGGKLGVLEGMPVIGAAFHPKNDTLFVMRHGEVNIQQYDVQGKKVANSYALDKPLVIKGKVSVTDMATLTPVGRDAVMANFRTVVRVNFHGYQSGRLKVSDSGDSLFAVIPTGVYMFPIKASAAPDPNEKPKPKIKVVEP